MARRHPLPPEIYALVEQTPATVLLEAGTQTSAETNKKSQFFTAPIRVCIAHSPAEIPALFAAIEAAVAAGHCTAGFFSYECASYFEPKAGTRAARDGNPLAWFGIYEHSYVFDHATGKFESGNPPELHALKGHDFSRAVNASESTGALAPARDPQPEIAAEFALTESAYAQRIAQIHEWIRAGDVYQLNFTAPLTFEAPRSVAALYARLRARQPVNYGALLHYEPGRHILSFSPELFFRIEEGGSHRDETRESGSNPGRRRIVTRPMKGTARRGLTTREDRQIGEWLHNDPKNRAENVMIVDLVRNDLGRVAKIGSVKVEELFAVERYPTLWQMTSTVTAELRPDAGFHDVFRALFPCGSVTGAPKVRATQLIAELEESPRGVYTGAIGFFSPKQTVFNVAIRTLELDGARGIMGVGSGIVIDSDPAEEYRECLLKADFLTGPAHRSSNAIRENVSIVSQPEEFFLIETMLWDGGYPLLELHLDRLEDSAEYFGFACDRAAVRAALEDHARPFAESAPPAPRRVRLLLGSEGQLQITDELLPPHGSGLQITNEPMAAGFEARSPQNCHPERVREADESKDLQLLSSTLALGALEQIGSPAGRVSISNTRTDPAEPMLYHKTTHRPVYAQAFAGAVRDGLDDVLFLNLRGEVTEGAISNVFVVKEGRWFTPPIECGLLPGVYRRHLLETRPDIEERVLSLDDLRTADAIYVCNAVRGLRRVILEG